jgi:hypothetical protein
MTRRYKSKKTNGLMKTATLADCAGSNKETATIIFDLVIDCLPMKVASPNFTGNGNALADHHPGRSTRWIRRLTRCLSEQGLRWLSSFYGYQERFI